ncbi:uracil-DNA glycosylase [Oceaniovalibus guishaninsula JLT2003]|uniref:Uracil-DNA glycosylase n=1 Tax=Oceaniovalibus guishaninsula JLT2003 TaxID=1231392 RepID=K2GLY6_9RHOB|nr:uracil-DNA glycosylase [Oceaniovalibus guishaninsula]EKE43726.1 uracil-DNA glycosylase [Oceaniovalibus guishaninsula JLT2003]
MPDPDEYRAALAQLAWQVELGADEAIGEDPVDRYAAVPEAPKAAPQMSAAPSRSEEGAMGVAQAAARAAGDLAGLEAAIAAFEGCELKRGARATIFGQGPADARLVIVTDAPGRAEEQARHPAAGRAGALLDRMLAAIGLARKEVRLVPVVPWRPPLDRDPSPGELESLRPFLSRHLALVAPDIVVAMGHAARQGVLGTDADKDGWSGMDGRDVLSMPSPAALLRDPLRKREAWAALLALQDRLRR